MSRVNCRPFLHISFLYIPFSISKRLEKIQRDLLWIGKEFKVSFTGWGEGVQPIRLEGFWRGWWVNNVPNSQSCNSLCFRLSERVCNQNFLVIYSINPPNVTLNKHTKCTVGQSTTLGVTRLRVGETRGAVVMACQIMFKERMAL